MKQKPLVLALTTLTLLANTVQASDIDNSDILHYTIGGGPVISLPARQDSIRSTTLGVGWDMNLQCGLLDPQVTVRNQLNGITNGYKDMMGSILDNATSAVMSMPGYYIQKRDPGLYDMLTNGVLQGKFDFDDGRTSCEGMVETMGEFNKDKAYNAMARAEAWTQAVKSGDAVRAKNEVLKDMGDSGITWVGGAKYGGRHQPPINAVQDVSEVGFHLLSTAEQKANNQGLYRYWDSAEAMSTWLTTVIGSQSVQTGMDKSLSSATPGVGLTSDVVTSSAELEKELRQALINRQDTRHYPKLLLDALAERKVDDNTIARIASELALSHTVEKALYARRALLTGQYEVNVAQHDTAQLDIDKAVNRLERDIDMLRYEAQVRQDIGPKTALEALDNLRFQQSQVQPESTKADSTFLDGTFNPKTTNAN
ncbi:integrating conjugative element protein [Vibrio sp. TBV020]|uniref:integrating conjugative element protein n=1 Tax=Vibrio sp. TBV020 TaxID=3137398 RepID=UPI0038CD6760